MTIQEGRTYMDTNYEVLLEQAREQSAREGQLTEIQLPQDIEFRGKVSLKNRDLGDELLERALSYIEKCYVRTDPDNGYLRCIDERPNNNYEESDNYADYLGPQIPGATPLEVVSFYIPASARGTTFDEAASDWQKINSNNFTPGGHDDDHSVLGCGAIATIPEQTKGLSVVADYSSIVELARTLLGKNFDDKTIGLLSRCAGNTGLDNFTPGDAKKLLEDVKNMSGDEQVIERKKGVHKGVALVINTVPGSTFHTNHYSKEFADELQVFNWDIWYDFHVANELAESHGKEFANEYLHCKVLLGLITWTLLTDGSLKVFVRQPSENS